MAALFDAVPATRRRSGAPLRLMSLVILLLIATASAWAGTFPVFGPERFTVTPGPKAAFTRSFSAPKPGAQYYLRAHMESVSNGRVLLNGAVVIGSGELGRSVSVLQKPVQLAASNVLSVELQSLHSAITIDIYGIDDDVPTIAYTLSRGPNRAGWYASDVIVTFQCADATSGIASCSSPVTISAEGPNQVTGVATDFAGNSGSTRVTLNLDKTAPVISFSEPSSGATVSTSRVTVRGQISDAVSQIKAASCNGQPIVVADGGFSCNVGLSQGENAIRVQATDVADNTGTGTLILKYAAATAGPTVVIVSPATLSAVNATSIGISGVVQTTKPGSLQVRVNGVGAALSTTAPPGFNRSFTATVPLREGQNIVTAVGTDGGVSSGSIIVTRDSTAPMLAIDAPVNGAIVADATISVAGRVNDLIGPAVGADTAVSVNGKAAVVRNGSFLATDLPLVPGPNAITVTATDSAGNARSTTGTVNLQDAAGQRIRLQTGNRQQGAVGSVLPNALTVLLTDKGGAPVAGRSVVFRVLRGDGSFVAGGPEPRSLAVTTDANGSAQVSFRLGSRSGAGNNIVVATAAGFVGTVLFVASAEPGPAVGVKSMFGDNQIGVPGQLLAAPFIVMAHDAAGNPVPGVPVTYTVVRGGGKLDDQESVVRNTGNDGRTSAVLALGTQEGLNNHSVTATIPGLVGLPAIFTASTPAGTGTQLRGLVLDESNSPLSGVAVRVLGTSVQATTAAGGQFTLTNVPPGKVSLEIDGSTGNRPSVDFDVVVQPGQDNSLPAPIFLASPDPATKKVVGGANEVALSLATLPSAMLTVAPNSVTCPGGAPSCEVSFTQVHSDKLPLPPSAGITPKLNWAVLPSGVRFDPPARLTLPNAEGLRPGQVVELFSFDYELGQFVSNGTAMVSEDGATITSDLGAGIARSGWGFVQSPPTALSCALSCDDGNACTTDTVGEPCFCEHAPRSGGCEDGLYCTSADGVSPGPDVCGTDTGCTGKHINDVERGRLSVEFSDKNFKPIVDLTKKLGKVQDVLKDGLPVQGLACQVKAPLSPELGLYVAWYSRCCEDVDEIRNAGLTLGGTARLPLAQVECGVFFGYKKLLSGALVVGIRGSLLFEQNGSFSPCPNDDTCGVMNRARGEVDAYVEARIDVLGGIAGASVRGSYGVALGPKQTCTGPCGLALPPFDPGVQFMIDQLALDCNTTLEMCAGPLVASGKIKLFGFIKIGFTYKVPGTGPFCKYVD